MRKCQHICGLLILCASAISAGATSAYCHWHSTSEMTLERAMELVGEDLDTNQRIIVAGAIGRGVLAGIEELRKMASSGDPSAIAAAARLIQIEKALR